MSWIWILRSVLIFLIAVTALYIAFRLGGHPGPYPGSAL